MVWGGLEEVMKPVERVLAYDPEALRRSDEAKRKDWWDEIENVQGRFEDFMFELPEEVMDEVLSEMELAKLLLATAANANGEKSPLINSFSSRELELVERFERYSVFDLLTVDEIVERIARREEIYDLIMEYYRNEYSDLDGILDDPKIRRRLRCAFKKRYKKRLEKVKEGAKAYVEKYGPVFVVEQIEEIVWRKIKESEDERRRISERLRKRMEELSLRLKPLENVEEKSQTFMEKPHGISMGKYFHVMVIASPTGWDDKVVREISSREFARNYVSRFVSLCLVDSITGDVYYNPADERVARFIEFFKPQFDRERLRK